MDVPYDLTSYVRVLNMATTPTSEDFLQVSKIAGAGILLVASIALVIVGAVWFRRVDVE